MCLDVFDLEMLKKGETLIAPRASMNGEKGLYLFQLDRETKEIIKTRLNSVVVPAYLMDIELTPKNKSDLLQGKSIELEDRYGNKHRVAIDLINPKGYSIVDQTQKSKLSVVKSLDEKSSTRIRR